MNNAIQYASPAPYPAVQVCGQNPIYARQMLGNIDPRLWGWQTRQRVYWTPGYNHYPR